MTKISRGKDRAGTAFRRGWRAGQGSEIDFARQFLASPKKRCMRRRVAIADRCQERIDQGARSTGSGFEHSARDTAPRGGQDHPVAVAPQDDGLAGEMGGRHLDVAVEPLQQMVDIAGDDVAAVAPTAPRLVPGEKGVQRRVGRKGGGAQARWHRRLGCQQGKPGIYGSVAVMARAGERLSRHPGMRPGKT